ncbi:hypothetical protein HKD37_07G019358 [Glycine soja]
MLLPPGAEILVVHVDPATGKADGPHRKKLRTYLGIVARDKVDVTYENWKEAEFDIPEASESRTKKKLLQTARERWRQFKSDLTRKWALVADQDGVKDTVCEKYGFSKEKWARFCQTHRDPSWEVYVCKKAQAIQKHNTAPHVLSRGGYDYLEQKLLAEKTKKKLEEAAQSGSVDDYLEQKLLADRCGLYIEADPARLVAMGRVYGGSTVVHNTPLLPGQVKVSVEEVTDAFALVPALHTFLAWPTHLVKSLSQQVAVSLAKPPPKPDPVVDDPLYLMTLTIPELFLRPYQVRWDATLFGVFNPDFPLYIKHEDLSEIAHGGQCLSISVLQLWILHLIETCMRVGNSYIYGFLEPQSIQRFHCSGHWQMVVILPKEHLVVWFSSLHNRPDNYLKEIINSALKGLNDAPQPKSKASARWIVVKYFNDPRPLEPERLKALRIQWAQFYLRVRDQA